MERREDVLDDEPNRPKDTIRSGSSCFIRFMFEQILVPALNTSAKMLKKNDDRTQNCL